MNSPVQEYLFRRIKAKLPAEASLADVIADLLHVSNDSAYRRIRGETPLVLEEAKILCEAFGLSLDETLNHKENSVSFTAFNLNNEHYSFKSYLKDILQNLKLVASFDQKEIIYLTKDFSIFHNFLHKPLFAFRYFFWMKSILQHPDFVSLKFSMDILANEIEELGQQIIRTYNTIPSTEIWNTECVNSTISQIEYYREAGYFASKDDVVKIYHSLRDTIEHLRLEAASGSKFYPGESPDFQQQNFQFYYNRVVLGDNTILTILNGKKIVYLNYDVLNYMVTQDEKFCNDVHSKLLNLMRRATILSNVSEKQRNIFFNILLKKIPNHSTASL
ncbi:MAG TPA: helix-turn-helix domain-containing protein [Flavisolibacter sp.]|nr:helix-turn-helix domain-containing protein [Flavisolibacter sp.]